MVYYLRPLNHRSTITLRIKILLFMESSISIWIVFSRTELIRRMRRFQVANHSCLMIKYSKDNRYDKSSVATHDKLVISFLCSRVTNLSSLLWCHKLCVSLFNFPATAVAFIFLLFHIKHIVLTEGRGLMHLVFFTDVLHNFT